MRFEECTSQDGLPFQPGMRLNPHSRVDRLHRQQYAPVAHPRTAPEPRRYKTSTTHHSTQYNNALSRPALARSERDELPRRVQYFTLHTFSRPTVSIHSRLLDRLTCCRAAMLRIPFRRRLPRQSQRSHSWTHAPFASAVRAITDRSYQNHCTHPTGQHDRKSELSRYALTSTDARHRRPLRSEN